MKNILNFLHWQWRQWSLGDIAYFIAIFLISFGISSDRLLLTQIGAGIIIAIVFKWLWVNSVMANYKKFKQQEENLFKEIKGE
jgi:TM2 domain-containing membrane protein YozV